MAPAGTNTRPWQRNDKAVAEKSYWPLPDGESGSLSPRRG